ncbi:MAG TPA: hypothetical protein VM122_06425 [Usitatibacter sp.]|nr:hypothetical protein [Usitatibacter sp.]
MEHAQVMGGQSQPGENGQHTEDRVPNFLTAQELQARDPARDEERRREDRRKNSLGEKAAAERKPED